MNIYVTPLGLSRVFVSTDFPGPSGILPNLETPDAIRHGIPGTNVLAHPATGLDFTLEPTLPAHTVGTRICAPITLGGIKSGRIDTNGVTEIAEFCLDHPGKTDAGAAYSPCHCGHVCPQR